MNTLGIEAIASVLGSGEESNVDPAVLARLDVDERFVRNKIGVVRRRVMRGDGDTSDLATAALRLLLSKTGGSPRDLEVVAVVTQNPDTNLPHVSALVHGKAGLPPTCAAFDIGLGCSGYVYGLCILSSFMAAARLSRGVLITADPYNKVIDRTDKDTALLFGDAATATLIGTTPVYRATDFSFGTDGTLAGALACTGGKLRMKGRQVFSYAATQVPKEIRRVLERAGVAMADVDAFYLHQGSRYIVETIAERLGIDDARLRFGLEDVGNTVSSSIPLLLERDMGDVTVRKAVLCGFGVGLSVGTCLCERAL